ncbi:MAG TPA: ROK family protein [Acidimicrobiales bacterium]
MDPATLQPTVLAVDIGGTKMAAGLVDGDGRLVARTLRPTPRRGDAEAVWSALVAAIDEVLAGAASPPMAVGVGSGGPMTPGGEQVSPLNIEGWRAFPLRARLARHAGVGVHIDNDAKALALGEGWLGRARGERNYCAMVVSTGVGGGLVVDGALLDGASANAGHIGHVNVVPDGAQCRCGARGCLEAEVSGHHLEARLGRPPADASIEERHRVGELVGRAAGSVANLLDIGLFVVAGSVALGFGADFFEPAQASLSRSARTAFSAGARIEPAGLGDEGPLVGAAAVAFRARGWDGVAAPPSIVAAPAGGVA